MQVQKQYHQHFFTDLLEKHGIGLENLIYYKDLTHYFVMTATKVSSQMCGRVKLKYQLRSLF